MRFSTGTFPHEMPLAKRVQIIVAEGVSEIELSGGEFEPDWRQVVDSFPNVNFAIHNYFPPPLEPFVLNLASRNEQILRRSREFCLQGLQLSNALGQSYYTFHAGFRFDPAPESLGQELVGDLSQNSPWESESNFVESIEILLEAAKPLGTTLLVENNVITMQNAERWGRECLMWTHSAEILEFLTSRSFDGLGLLLDVGHLKVSSKTLGLDFEKELETLAGIAQGLHLHSNDGFVDSHGAPIFNRNTWNLIRSCPAEYVTYEVKQEQISETIALVRTI